MDRQAGGARPVRQPRGRDRLPAAPAEPGALELQPPQLVELPAHVVREPVRVQQAAGAVAAPVQGHGAAEIGERVPGDLHGDAALPVVGAGVGECGQMDQDREPAAERREPRRQRGQWRRLGRWPPHRADLPDESCGAALHQPAGDRLPGRERAGGQQRVDVLVRHRQVQQSPRQLAGLGQPHPGRPGVLWRLPVPPAGQALVGSQQLAQRTHRRFSPPGSQPRQATARGPAGGSADRVRSAACLMIR